MSVPACVPHFGINVYHGTLFTSAHGPLGLHTAISHSQCIAHRHNAFVLLELRCLHHLVVSSYGIVSSDLLPSLVFYRDRSFMQAHHDIVCLRFA